MPLFDNVLYHISQSLSEDTCTEISRILDYNGGVRTSLKNATHVISNTIEFEGCDTLGKTVFCITPFWVERSMELGSLQDAQYFSADKAQFFSGVVAACAGLPKGDVEFIQSGIETYGGSWREGLTRDVTHLIVPNTNSEKYQVAMHFREEAHITPVLPHWFDECWSMQMFIPTTLFQFPDPPYLKHKHEHEPNWYKTQLSIPENSDYLKDGFNKKALFNVLTREPSFPEEPPPRDVWQGRRILLSTSLELNEDRKKALEVRIHSTGGLVLSGSAGDEGTVVDSADVLITRYRSGPAYARALNKDKTIGTLTWFLYVDKIGILSRPRDQLLHYPVRSDPIPGFEHHEITVTNYQGNARDYLKKLIQLMGATFTPTMSGKNTVVIAAYKSGTKTSKAEEWSVPVVHHKWLEDCFIEWRNLTPALKQYVVFAPGFNYGTLLGERGVGHVGLVQVDKDRDQDQAIVKTSATPVASLKSPQRPQLTAADTARLAVASNSFRDALEIEEVEEVLNISESHLDIPVKIGPPQSPLKKKLANKPLSNTTSGPSKALSRISTLNAKKREQEQEQDQDQDQDQDEVKKKTAGRKVLPSNLKRKSKLSTDKKIDSDGSVREVPSPAKKPKKLFQKLRKDSDEETELSEHSRPKPVSKSSSVPRSPIKTSTEKHTLSSSSPLQSSDSDSDVVEVRSLKSIKSSPKAKSKTFTKPKSKISAKPTSTKRPLSASAPDFSDSDVVETKRPRAVKTYKSPTKTKAIQAETSSSSDKGDPLESVGSPRKRLKAAARKIDLVAFVDPSESDTTAKPNIKKPQAKSLTFSKHESANFSLSDHSVSVVSVIKDALTSRRQAAAAATQRLRTEIMPDVINYENERKKNAASTRRRKSSLGRVVDTFPIDEGEDSEDNFRIVKKARTSAAGESENGTNDLVTHVRSGRKTVVDEGESKGRKKGHGSSKSNEAAVNQSDKSSSIDPKKIRIMTTKIDIPDDVEQNLTKLGVKFTTKPTDCTHLIASRMARTEKFLCALPQAPYVLNQDWLIACAREKKIVAEGPFVLQDPDAEHKHKFKLSEALQRAKEMKKRKVKLLQGHTFYITPNVKVDHDMFVNVLKANGADGKRSTPNARVSSDIKHVHLISCLKDEHLWRALHRSGIPIYSQELVFSAAFKQLIDWDSPEMRVQAEIE